MIEPADTHAIIKRTYRDVSVAVARWFARLGIQGKIGGIEPPVLDRLATFACDDGVQNQGGEYMFLVCMFLNLGLQQWVEPPDTSWVELARPWMTLEEEQLFESLSASDKIKFRGTFVARRLEYPEHWSKTGLFLPCFFHPKRYGDIRDALLYLLGEPEERKASPLNVQLPREWNYPGFSFSFEPHRKNRVALTRDGRLTWDRALQGMVRHPGIRYGLTAQRFGQNRLPEEIRWIKAELRQLWVAPQPTGGKARVVIAIPDEFKKSLQNSKGTTRHTMELLTYLKAEQGEDRSSLSAERVRHDSHPVDLAKVDTLYFEITLPEGHFQSELLVYSGFLPFGLRVETPITVLPVELPRIGDPIICDQWLPAGIKAPGDGWLQVGNFFYKPTTAKSVNRQVRVLVPTPFIDTRLFLQNNRGGREALTLRDRAPGWAAFALPARSESYRLVAEGHLPNSQQFAISAVGIRPELSERTLKFEQADYPNYLNLETLTLAEAPARFLLFVNGRPYMGSQSQTIPWPGLNWGKRAALRFEWQVDNHWYWYGTGMKRSEIYQEIRVKPKYLVAGTRSLKGQPVQVPLEVKLEGLKVPVRRSTPLSGMDKLWGLVINDSLLHTAAWPNIRQEMLSWLKRHTGKDDLVYLVHISDRPELVLAPTATKSELVAAMESLEPGSNRENYFTAEYLINALTHLPEHQTRPHQVLLVTNQLTEELKQMETLLPMLRQTGLQLYNLEFPFLDAPGVEERFRDWKDDALLAMKVQEDEDQHTRSTTRDNLQEQRNVLAGWRFQFKSGKQKRQVREEAARAEAFREAFNTQLSFLTAGMTYVSGAKEGLQGLRRFFDELDLWQQSLVHLELPVPYIDESMVRMQVPQGTTSSWTLVEWRPQDDTAK